ncbi:MAG: putative pterin-4-alpha-carbinolamine dehydratase [Phycisphaerae bacterium]|nr:MAG: putative pterin-4-alpha-carbinolamine dehydratase [Phycisphaerae bacterium]
MPEKLTPDQVRERLEQLSGWELSDNSIVKSYQFENYYQTMAFVNSVAWVAHQMNHHPNLEVGYNRCVVWYSTHDAGGVTEIDLQAASRVEALGGL